MKITIHRGINQIGGCITEIATANNRILIDLGQNLPDNEGNVIDNLANDNAIAELTTNIDAIFYTHYHGDHVELFKYVPAGVEHYIGETAKKIMLCKSEYLSWAPNGDKEAVQKIEKFKTFQAKQKIAIGDITVTPYFVSHSAADANMFMIEADGKRVLHTGDFRGHGYLSKGLLPTLKKYILTDTVDVLITEGTMLSRLDERVRHENELKQEVIELLKQYKNVFVMCSSTDLERLASVHAAFNEADKSNRPFVCDKYQKSILQIFTETAGTKSDLFNFEAEHKSYDFKKNNQKLIDWIKDKGCCMLIRSSKKFNDWLDFLLPQLDNRETVVIYSMWKEYINPASKHAKQEYLSLLEKFSNLETIHTSGHASADCLAEVCNLVNPSVGIIPIHSEHSEEYRNLDITDKLKSKIITSSEVKGNIEIQIDGLADFLD